ncbi:COX15/CtaA family protein [Oleiharenicola sp. Vm1]|uniref:COX15/CtaA family protein n=1 Tax=Oleiharenicola sp. Vm1 TaxID=3398393 RepID=UPI0039F634F8
MQRSSAYKPGLAWFAALGSAWVFVLVTLGAFTTSIGAGMAFPDWPLSNGSVNPQGWLTDIAKFAEHSHRLSGATMGLITIGLAVWLWRTEERRWLRNLGWWALAIVIVQGFIGGKRVLLDSLAVPGFQMTLGQMLRIPHGVLAQVFVCVLFAIAAATSRSWTERGAGLTGNTGEATRRLGFWSLFLLLTQLWIAAAMRHNYAGMAIPYFPFSTAEHDLLPLAWDYRIALQFAHRVMAVVLGVALVAFVRALWKDAAVSAALRWLGAGLLGLVALQITLGAEIIWSGRNAYITTAHVLVGALTLATTFLLVFLTHHHALDGARRP